METESSQDTTKTTLRLSKDLHRRLKIRAVEEGRHMETLASEAFEQYLTTPKGGKVSRGKKH